MYDISFMIPAIRTHFWPMVYETMLTSCNRHSFEIIFAGPFDPPVEMAHNPAIKYLKTYMKPSCTLQIAAIAAEGDLVVALADDTKYVPNTMSDAIDLYHATAKEKDVVTLKYSEGCDFQGEVMPENFWMAWSHKNLRLPGIPHHYQISSSPIIKRKYFLQLGGVDCEYEYPNFNMHDFTFRLQFDGGVVRRSKSKVVVCTCYPQRMEDHGPIHDAHDADYNIFYKKYNNPNALQDNPIYIDINNWEKYQQPWERRFKKLYTSYKEMMRDTEHFGDGEWLWRHSSE